MKRISDTLGIGLNKVQTTVSEYNQTKIVTSPNRRRNKPGVVDKIDDFDKNAIRRKVHSFWHNKELPTLAKVLTAINEDSTLPNMKETSLRIVLKCLNFKFTKRQRNSILTERKDLLSWRRKYLISIRRFREEGKPIYYLDETWLNTGDCVSKVWVDQTVTSSRMALLEGLSTGPQNPTGKGTRLIVLHIGSAAGFVPSGLLCFQSKKNSSDYHDEMTGKTFQEWFEEILPLLEDNAVIVLDNAPYHSVKKEKTPTTSWRKAQIVEWLESKGEEIDPNQLTKNDLEIVDRLKPRYNAYIIDEMAKDAGKMVLRLPPYHCELNPIELVWSMVKSYVKSNNTTYKTIDVKHLLHQAIDRVKPEDWQSFIRHVKDEEQKFWDVDFICNEMTDELLPDPRHILSIGESTDEDNLFE
ncbi:uncharacterized protein LOC113560174 [Rhopalosiphum maidis]|uniref:uncharacterized protein LOC113560174 n=1 Tax=Rhopalosiphum maidis TaxID=43146 RepID=UPI000EFF04A3|nr:uncharacterized protein LOC113560174 [Rhopalosiphum maidis]